MNNIFILVAFAAFISFSLTPIVKKIAIYFNIMDIPKDERRIHNKPIPLLGGLSIYIAFILVVILKSGSLTKEEIGIIIGASIIVIGGILDDKFDIKPWQKLLFQFSAALGLVITNVQIVYLTNPFNSVNPMISIGILSIPISILWIVGITNAINLIDGLDGLAAGITLISAITILVAAAMNSRTEAYLLSAIFIGAVAGFLPFNFNPASIFMGDTGSQLLGFLLAAISMEGATKSTAAFAIAFPILAMGLPIYDTLAAMIRRKVNGMPILKGDRGHFHHRLLDKGLSQKQAVLVMYGISAVLGVFAIIAIKLSDKASYILLGIVVIAFIVIAWKYGIFKENEG
ncbi:MAG TPA: MraY family glycosyltransferase [Clostridiaceae bacterium]